MCIRDRENLIRSPNVFRCWAVSSIFSLLWLIPFTGGIYSENVDWCWSLFTVQKVFLVITDWKQTHRRTFQVFQYYTKLTAKIKIARRKNVKALSAFLNVKAVRKIQESWLKRNFRKAEKATVSIMFGKLWFVLVLGPVGPQGPLGRRFMMSLFSTANQGQEFDLHMNNIQKTIEFVTEPG